jgi:predicted flap endonuclease-1-like 5' DNA nuclease
MKMTKMKRTSKRRVASGRKASGVRDVSRLEAIPNVGPAVAADLRQLGITTPGDLLGRDLCVPKTSSAGQIRR